MRWCCHPAGLPISSGNACRCASVRGCAGGAGGVAAAGAVGGGAATRPGCQCHLAMLAVVLLLVVSLVVLKFKLIYLS